MAIKAIDGDGGNIYLITRGDGKQVQQSANGVVIWAHGVANGNSFKLQDATLQFLCPNTYALRSSFYQHIANQQLLALPPMSVSSMGLTQGDDCPDYKLTKAISYHINTGKHKGWLLNDIQTKLGGTDGGMAGEALGYATYDHLESFVKSGRSQLDIVTIRNRDSKGTTLKYVLDKLRGKAFAYGAIYCHFCRVAKPGKPDPSLIWDIEDTLPK